MKFLKYHQLLCAREIVLGIYWKVAEQTYQVEHHGINLLLLFWILKFDKLLQQVIIFDLQAQVLIFDLRFSIFQSRPVYPERHTLIVWFENKIENYGRPIGIRCCLFASKAF